MAAELLPSICNPSSSTSSAVRSVVRSFGRAKEVAQPEKLTDFVHGSRRSGFGDGLQLVSPRFDSFFGQSKTQVGDVPTSEEKFLKVDLDIVPHQASK